MSADIIFLNFKHMNLPEEITLNLIPSDFDGYYMDSKDCAIARALFRHGYRLPHWRDGIGSVFVTIHGQDFQISDPTAVLRGYKTGLKEVRIKLTKTQKQYGNFRMGIE